MKNKDEYSSDIDDDLERYKERHSNVGWNSQEGSERERSEHNNDQERTRSYVSTPPLESQLQNMTGKTGALLYYMKQDKIRDEENNKVTNLESLKQKV